MASARFVTAGSISCCASIGTMSSASSRASQSESGALFSRQAGLPEGGAGSIILVDNGVVLLRSAAVIRMLNVLGFPFSLAGVFRLIPRAWRDSIYDCVARHRTKWFGKRQTCRLPSPAERHRFL